MIINREHIERLFENTKKKFENESLDTMGWMDKGIWLFKGIIIGVVMTAFMCFVLI